MAGEPTTMRLSLRSTLALTTILSFCTLPALGQDRLDQDVVAANSALNDQQQQQVLDYVEVWTEDLASGDTRKMIEARDELIKPTLRGGVDVYFLQAYSKYLLPKLEPIISGSEHIRGENAMRVAAFLHTPQSAMLIVERTDPDKNPDEFSRLVAAGLMATVVRDVRHSGLNSGELTALARTLANSIRKETTNWHVVLKDFRALGEIAASPELTELNRRDVKALQFQSFSNLVQRAGESTTPSPLMEAVFRSLLDLRSKLISSGGTGQTQSPQLVQEVKNTLLSTGKAAVKQWSGLSSDASLRNAYEGVLRVGAQILSLLGTTDSQTDRAISALAEAMPKGKAAVQKAIDLFPNS